MSDSNKKNLSWFWYIALIMTLGILAAFITGYFNSKQQLKRKDIDEAIERWDKAGIKNYSLKYVQKIRNQPEETYEVTVRQGRVTRVLRNDLPLERNESFTMASRLDDIQKFHQDDTDAARRVFVRGYFDAKNGRLLSYTRRVMGSDERVSITVQEFREE